MQNDIYEYRKAKTTYYLDPMEYLSKELKLTNNYVQFVIDGDRSVSIMLRGTISFDGC
jgi:hypothetical protein